MQVFQQYLTRAAAHSPGNCRLKGAVPVTIGDAQAAVGWQQEIRDAVTIYIAYREHDCVESRICGFL